VFADDHVETQTLEVRDAPLELIIRLGSDW
jgi:hypothetical protein